VKRVASRDGTRNGAGRSGKHWIILRDENSVHFEAHARQLFTYPWLARDESIALILDDHASREQFVFEHAGRWLSADEQHRALTYLELQRMLLLMYTSCGWFFNDISGIETIQILRYAGRAIDLMDQLGLPRHWNDFWKYCLQRRATGPRLELVRTSIGNLSRADFPSRE
jgi:hypothetical protein